MAMLVLSAVARLFNTDAERAGDASYDVLISVVDMAGAPVTGLQAANFTFGVHPVSNAGPPMYLLEIVGLGEETAPHFEGVYHASVRAAIDGVVLGTLWRRLAINVFHNYFIAGGTLENPQETVFVNRGRIVIPVGPDIGDEASDLGYL